MCKGIKRFTQKSLLKRFLLKKSCKNKKRFVPLQKQDKKRATKSAYMK